MLKIILLLCKVRSQLFEEEYLFLKTSFKEENFYHQNIYSFIHSLTEEPSILSHSTIHEYHLVNSCYWVR